MNCRFQEGDACNLAGLENQTFDRVVSIFGAMFAPKPLERFTAAGIPEDRIACEKATYTFNFPGSPSEFVDAFRSDCGPTMNAFDAANKEGRSDALRRELEELFARRVGGMCITAQPRYDNARLHCCN